MSVPFSMDRIALVSFSNSGQINEIHLVSIKEIQFSEFMIVFSQIKMISSLATLVMSSVASILNLGVNLVSKPV